MQVKINLFCKPYKNITQKCKKFLHTGCSNRINSLPIVSTPIVVYASLKGVRDTANTNNCRRAIEEQRELLNKGKITQREFNIRKAKIQDYYDHADSASPKVSSASIKKDSPSFKGEESVMKEDFYPFSMKQELDNIDTEISSLDLEQSQLSLNMDSMQEAIDTGMLDDTELSGLLDHLADHPGAIAATGLAAEFLPGTRFAKPVVDLFKGDIGKALVGGATRLGEMALGPIKLTWAGINGLIGYLSRLSDPDDEEAGFWKGVKSASKSWAKGRDKIENAILDRENPEDIVKRKQEASKRLREEKKKELEYKKEELLSQRRKIIEAQERKLAEEAMKQEQERIEAEKQAAEAARLRKCELRERAKRMNPQIQKIKAVQTERKVQKFEEYERAYEELMQIKQRCIMEQYDLKNEQITKYGKSQAKKRVRHPIIELDYRFVYITRILSQLDSYMKQKHLLKDIQFLDVLKNPSELTGNQLKQIIEQLNEILSKTSKRK